MASAISCAVLIGFHHTPGQNHVTGDAMPTHLEEARRATEVRDDAIGQLGKPKTGVGRRDANIAEQGTLERSAHHPSVQGADDRDIEFQKLQAAFLASVHQAVVR
jgi:hypothetical protein